MMKEEQKIINLLIKNGIAEFDIKRRIMKCGEPFLIVNFSKHYVAYKLIVSQSYELMTADCQSLFETKKFIKLERELKEL